MGLARTMTLKASAAGLDLGGGKAVMLDDGTPEPREARLEAAAAGVIDELDGAYITAEDIGTTTADMDLMSRAHPLRGRSLASDGGGGDPRPSPPRPSSRPAPRPRGRHRIGDFDGRRVGVIGLGKVGRRLAPS